MILPAALRYQARGGRRGERDQGGRRGQLVPRSNCSRSLTATISEFQAAMSSLDKALAHHGDGDPYHHAKHMRDTVLPAMTQMRTAGRQAGDDGRRRPVAAADLSGDAVHQVTYPLPARGASKGRLLPLLALAGHGMPCHSTRCADLSISP